MFFSSTKGGGKQLREGVPKDLTHSIDEERGIYQGRGGENLWQGKTGVAIRLFEIRLFLGVGVTCSALEEGDGEVRAEIRSQGHPREGSVANLPWRREKPCPTKERSDSSKGNDG